MSNINGLISSKSVCVNGNIDSNMFVRVGATGDSEIIGDLTVGGNVDIAGSLTMTDSDISNGTGLLSYTVGASGFFVYPSVVKLCSAGTITKQTSSTNVPEADFLIPFDGYYGFTLQINLDGVGDVTSANDYISTFLDVSGGSLTAINGTLNTITVVETSTNIVRIVVSGFVGQKMTAGQYLKLYHVESTDATFTFSSANIIAYYNYLGNRAI